MTKAEFLAHLGTAGLSEWTLAEGKAIRMRIESQERIYCPLTWVCWLKTGKFLPIHYYVEAGQMLDMDRRDILDISNAADHRGDGESRALREQMLRACRAKPVEMTGDDNGSGHVQ